MTCAEVWQLDALPTEAATPSLALAVMRHLHGCETCKQRAEEVVREREARMNVVQRVVLSARASELQSRMAVSLATDPEAT